MSVPIMLLPKPGSPANKLSFANGNRPGQSHRTAFGVTSDNRTIFGLASVCGTLRIG